MDWRQRSERRGDGIAAEHVVMAPKAHRFAVDDQIVLYLLRLGAQPVMLRNVGVERVPGVGVLAAILPLEAIQIEAAADAIEIFHCFTHAAQP
jgi:hypothetical protein